VTQTGDTPFTGTIYFGASRMRIEGVSNGEQMTLIMDPAAGTIIMVMPADRVYVVMDSSRHQNEPSAVGQFVPPRGPCRRVRADSISRHRSLVR
jgi:hypothetical protein